jgi:hypothetical protein
VGQLLASLLLVCMASFGIIFRGTTYSLIPYLMCFARFTIFACNYVFIYEALQSWLPLPQFGTHAWRHCIASHAETLFLASCTLYLVWEVLDVIGVGSNSKKQRAIIAGVCLGAGALTRAFGASLLLWAQNTALKDQTVEERKIRAMLTNWYVQPEAVRDATASEKGSQWFKRHARCTSEQYLDASAVATRLMVPDTLPRALSLQQLASCGAVLVLLLNVAQQLKRSKCQLDTYLVHMVRNALFIINDAHTISDCHYWPFV